MSKEEGRAWRKRQAVQIAAMLPEDPEQALAVLRSTRRLVRTFLMKTRQKAGRRD